MKTSLVIALLAVGFAAQAQPMNDVTLVSEGSIEAFLSANPAEMPASCIAANISDQQKAAIGDAWTATKKDMIPLKADLQASMDAYEKTVKDSTSSLALADTAGLKIKDSYGKIADAKLSLVNNIFYNIIPAENRSLAFDCMKDMAKLDHENKIDQVCKARATPGPTPAP